jgi:deoxyadenosine/deoxycytidine kinase
VDFRYLVIEGPLGLGKTALAERLGVRLDATVVLDDTENPFLADFYGGRPGSAFQAQLFFTLSRHRQQTALRQGDLFSQTTICNYLFERDRLYAFLNLDDNELFIYERLYELLSRDLVAPDLVIYLQAPTDVLVARLHDRHKAGDGEAPVPDPAYLQELNEAYHHFFFHYTATPLLVVETSHFMPEPSEAAMDDLLHQIETMASGTRYYVPRGR